MEMFTGIIERVGEVVGLEETGAGGRLVIAAPGMAEDLAVGESVAVNGCCLTVTETDAENGEVRFDLLGETLRVTNLGGLEARDTVNLERAVRAGDRMSGHFVQGHVDCVSEIISIDAEGEDHRLELVLPVEFARYLCHKGSIAVDGISLTVAEVADGRFVVWIIPHTFEVTNLGRARKGGRVNLEFDVLAKYVERQAEGRK